MRYATRCRLGLKPADQYGHLIPGDEQAAELIRTTLDRAFRPGA